VRVVWTLLSLEGNAQMILASQALGGPRVIIPEQAESALARVVPSARPVTSPPQARGPHEARSGGRRVLMWKRPVITPSPGKLQGKPRQPGACRLSWHRHLRRSTYAAGVKGVQISIEPEADEALAAGCRGRRTPVPPLVGAYLAGSCSSMRRMTVSTTVGSAACSRGERRSPTSSEAAVTLTRMAGGALP